MTDLRTCCLVLAAALAWPALCAAQEHDHQQGSSAQQEDAVRPAQSLPRTPLPVLTEADRAAARPPSGGEPIHHGNIHAYLLVKHLEAWDAQGSAGLAWEGEGWAGTDLHRVWLRSGAERHQGRTDAAHVELLYGRSIARWWDLVGGVRHDFRPGEARSLVAIGIQGLAPQNVHLQATAYLGDGRADARLELEYQLLLTNRLILQPEVEVHLAGSDDLQRGIGAGAATVAAGLRLRYEVVRRFAPYLGLGYERALGQTAHLRRSADGEVDELRLLAGVRMWF